MKFEDKHRELQKILRATQDGEEIGPGVRLNRMQNMAKDSIAIKASLLYQACSQLLSRVDEPSLRRLRRSRAWKVTFVGEGADDYSGPYHELISVMGDEINKHLPLLIPHANGQDPDSKVPQWDAAFNGERVKVLNPRISSEKGLQLLRFMGVVMGIAVRNSMPMKLRMAPIVWKQIAGEHISLEDFKLVDQAFYNSMHYLKHGKLPDDHQAPNRIQNQDDIDEAINSLMMVFNLGVQGCAIGCGSCAQCKEFGVLENKFVVLNSAAALVDLVPNGRKIAITFENRHQFINLAIQVRKNKCTLPTSISA